MLRLNKLSVRNARKTVSQQRMNTSTPLAHVHNERQHNDNKNKNTHSPSTQPRYGAIALAAGATAVGIFAYVNRDDEETLTLDDFNQLKSALIDSCKDSPDIELLMKGLIDSIGAGDHANIRKHLNELNHISFEFNPKQFKALINIAALQAKVHALEIMIEHFGETNVKSIPLAKKLLKHELRYEIEKQVSGYFNYYNKPASGLFNGSDMRVALAKHEEEFQQDHAQCETYGLDFIDDIAALFTYVKENQAKQGWRDDSIQQKFNNTAIISGDDGADDFNQFLDGLKQQVQNSKHPVVGCFIISAAHFTTTEIKIEKDGDNLKATILFSDSLGNLNAEWLSGYSHGSFIEILNKHFSKVDILSSEAKLQHLGHGCPIFSLIRTIQGIEADKTLGMLPQYTASDDVNLIFDYAHQHITRDDYALFCNNHGVEYMQPIQHFLPPVYTEITKSSFRNNREVDYQLAIGKDKVEFFAINTVTHELTPYHYINNPITPVGHLGWDLEQQECQLRYPERANEFHLSVYDGLTPQQTVESYTQTIGHSKRNTIVQTKAGEYGIGLSQWLVTKSPEEIKKMREDYVFDRKFKKPSQRG